MSAPGAQHDTVECSVASAACSVGTASMKSHVRNRTNHTLISGLGLLRKCDFGRILGIRTPPPVEMS
eukprot:1034521-Prymnesium_polylepis.1